MKSPVISDVHLRDYDTNRKSPFCFAEFCIFVWYLSLPHFIMYGLEKRQPSLSHERIILKTLGRVKIFISCACQKLQCGLRKNILQ